jgi:glycosyltransferase involved in cell wall biosynthesis
MLERARLATVQLRERLRASAFVSEMLGLSLMLRYLVTPGRPERRLEWLAAACRVVSRPVLRRLLAYLVRPWQQGDRAKIWRERQVGWTRYWRDYDLQNPRLTTSLLLKAPGPGGEKGVLYSSFEYNWMRLLAHHKIGRFLADYVLVGASSWSPPDYAVMLNLAGLGRDPVFIGVSNLADVAAYAVAEPTVRPLPIMACDWINPAFYQPRAPRARDIDVLMVANFSLFKRHRLLFRALRGMRRDLRVTLIGIPLPGRGEREIRAEAHAFGVTQELEILTNVDINTVTAYQCRAKVSVILSRREGSCVAVTESLFAGCPVAMMRNAHVGSKAYINDQTGILMTESRIHTQLSAFLESSASYRPSDWARAHITCHHTSTKLNAALRDYAGEAGYPWTRDIAALCWRYVPSYVNPADKERLAPAVARLREEHGVELQEFHYGRR